MMVQEIWLEGTEKLLHTEAEMVHMNSKLRPTQIHCIIQQQALCNQVMNWESVMDIVVVMVNSI
jgi:hypothetical protein